MRRHTAAKAVFFCFVIGLLLQFGVRAEALSVNAKAAVLIDGRSGRVLFAHNADTRCPMASTTKIMTALLALENCALDEIVTASQNASGVPGTSIYLGVGEQLTMKEMLLGLMLRSGNDAAVAIAEHMAGSTAAFADMMNDRAAELGADAHFVTPNGLDADGHGATALAMALIAREALKNEVFREIVGTQRAVIPWRDSSYNRVLVNKNRLLKEYDGATGVKTGFTKKAGRCLVFSAERDGMELIGVVMNCGTWFESAKRMLDWGFENYSLSCPIEGGCTAGWARVAGGFERETPVAAENDLAAAVCQEDVWQMTVSMPGPVRAPIRAGDCLGTAQLIVNGEVLAETRLLAERDVEKVSLMSVLVKILRLWLFCGGKAN